MRVLLAAVLLGAGALLGVAPSAAAANEYRYWSYWWAQETSWRYAPAGASHRVNDGDVEGWRLSVSPNGGAPAPRGPAGFGAICGDVPQQDGRIRVGLVVDYGTPQDAPAGQQPPAGVVTACAVVPTGATGFSVLGTHGSARLDAGFVCGINGYPAGECAVAVAPSPEPTAAPSPKPAPAPNRTPPVSEPEPSKPAKEPAARSQPSSPPAEPATPSKPAKVSRAAADDGEPDSGKQRDRARGADTRSQRREAVDAGTEPAATQARSAAQGTASNPAVVDTAAASTPQPERFPVPTALGLALAAGLGGWAVLRSRRLGATPRRTGP